jgi:hypothetical protein
MQRPTVPDVSDRIALNDLARIVWFAARLDHCADVVQIWTLLRFALDERTTYRILNQLDKGSMLALWAFGHDKHYEVRVSVITPLDDPADRVYGLEVHTPPGVDLSAEL